MTNNSLDNTQSYYQPTETEIIMTTLMPTVENILKDFNNAKEQENAKNHELELKNIELERIRIDVSKEQDTQTKRFAGFGILFALLVYASLLFFQKNNATIDTVFVVLITSGLSVFSGGKKPIPNLNDK